MPPLAPLARLRWSVVEPRLREMAPESVLEVGCGLGGFGARVARRGRYLGVEPDDMSFATARARVEASGGRVVHGMLADVAEGPFDLVCAFEVLEHIEDDRSALAEWVDRIGPGGWLLLSVPAGPDRFGPSDRAAGHFRRYSPDHLVDLVGEAGLTDVQVTYYGWPLGYVTEGVRGRIAARKEQSAPASMEHRTAGSGRMFQPGPFVGQVVRVATLPFEVAQRMRPDRGVGLVLSARKPAA
jgi:SAM-dependent methyltransferase